MRSNAKEAPKKKSECKSQREQQKQRECSTPCVHDHDKEHV